MADRQLRSIAKRLALSLATGIDDLSLCEGVAGSMDVLTADTGMTGYPFPVAGVAN